MSETMTTERAAEFGAAWNERDLERLVGYFTEDGRFYHGDAPEHVGTDWVGKDNVRRGVQGFWDRFPDGQFTDLRVEVNGDRGTFEWDFTATDLDGAVKVAHGFDLLEFRGNLVYRKAGFGIDGLFL